MVNSNKIKGRITEVGKNQEVCAVIMGISYAALNQKINNVRPMRLEEAEKLSEILEISDSEFSAYFFAPKVAKCNKMILPDLGEQ